MDEVRQRVSGRLALVVALFWFAGTAYGFWAVDLRARRPLDPATVAAYYDRTRLAPIAERWFRFAIRPDVPLRNGRGRATVVAVTHGDCDCNEKAARHLAAIARRYGATLADTRSAEVDWVAATPAALVFDADGRLLYVGPFSDEASCGSSGGYVERVLDDIAAHRTPATPTILGAGCFCTHDDARR